MVVGGVVVESVKFYRRSCEVLECLTLYFLIKTAKHPLGTGSLSSPLGALFACKNTKQRLGGFSSRTCLPTGWKCWMILTGLWQGDDKRQP